MKRRGRHRGKYDESLIRLAGDNPGPLACPICVRLYQLASYKRRPLPLVRNVTHGMGSRGGYHYRMCYEHYNIVSAHMLAETTHGYEEFSDSRN